MDESEAKHFAAGQTVEGRVICGAKTRSGDPCRRSPAKGRTRCKIHGGASLRGAASPTFRHGRYSKVLPARLAESYQSAMDDPAGVSVWEEMSLLAARQSELLAELDQSAGPAVWREARKAWRSFTKARTAGDVDAMRDAVADLDAIFGARADWSVWEELRTTIEGRRRLAETERKRIEAAQAYLTLTQARAWTAHLVEVIRAEVTDQGARERIAEAIQRAWGAAGEPAALPAEMGR